jgi:hypothetical protein
MASTAEPTHRPGRRGLQAAPPDASALDAAVSVAPIPLRPLRFGGRRQSVWPYTTARFPAAASDPINLVFLGRSDPRNLRAALLALDGDRPDFPDSPLAGARWKDAVGKPQAAFSESGGWAGSVIQLECGDYQPLRFHLRLFPAGAWTLANAHLDVSIPGTADHEVVAWELARRLVEYDFRRTGLLSRDRPTGESEPIHPEVFRRVDGRVLAGLPASLRDLLERSGSLTPDGQLLTGRRATMLDVVGVAAPAPRRLFHEVRIQVDQVVPKPFCSRGGDLVHARGPLVLRHAVLEEDDGTLESQTHCAGELVVTPVDPASGRPRGSASRADVSDRFTTVMGDRRTLISVQERRSVLAGPLAGEGMSLDMRVGPAGEVHFSEREHCCP